MTNKKKGLDGLKNRMEIRKKKSVNLNIDEDITQYEQEKELKGKKPKRLGD